MCDNFEKMGNRIAIDLLMMKRVREPTLTQIQKDSKLSVHGHADFKSIPAWLYNSQKHPGLPEHYLTQCTIENHLKSSIYEDKLPELPFEVNREVIEKLVIIPKHVNNKRKSESQAVPSLADLENGTVIINGITFPEEIKHNIEVFLNIHDKLLPCCYIAERSEVITSSPLTDKGRARCYYIPDPSIPFEISFMSSQEKLLRRCQYNVKWFDGSVPYDVLHENLS